MFDNMNPRLYPKQPGARQIQALRTPRKAIAKRSTWSLKQCAGLLRG